MYHALESMSRANPSPDGAECSCYISLPPAFFGVCLFQVHPLRVKYEFKMTTKLLKLLVTGDVDGKIKQLFQRLDIVQKKSGPFEMLLCVGNFFGSDDTEWKQCLDGSLKAPISIYILGPNSDQHAKHYPDSEGCELCHNVTYLGKKGIYTGATNLKLMYLSGMEGTESDWTHFNSRDIDALKNQTELESGFKGVDILVTSQWPKGISKYGVPPETKQSVVGSELISQLALSSKPRYHFCGLQGIYYERLPYRNHTVLMENSKHVTRFFGIAKVGNPEKQKWLYAFGIIPLSQMDNCELVKQPMDVTECPYSQSADSESAKSEGKKTQYFYDLEKLNTRTTKRRSNELDSRPIKRTPWQPAKPTTQCWFCLGSPDVAKHLVVSVGSDIYLALPKGGLVPDHVLICPIAHFRATTDLPPDATEEVEKFKHALKKFFASQNKVPVFFERNFRTQHFQIQVVPVPSGLEKNISTAFNSYAQMNKLQMKLMPESKPLDIPSKVPYFYVELPNGDKLVHIIKDYFPLQFGREVMANPELLAIPQKADWKNCSYTLEEETSMATDFKRKFQSFDFTI